MSVGKLDEQLKALGIPVVSVRTLAQAPFYEVVYGEGATQAQRDLGDAIVGAFNPVLPDPGGPRADFVQWSGTVGGAWVRVAAGAGHGVGVIWTTREAAGGQQFVGLGGEMELTPGLWLGVSSAGAVEVQRRGGSKLFHVALSLTVMR